MAITAWLPMPKFPDDMPPSLVQDMAPSTALADEEMHAITLTEEEKWELCAHAFSLMPVLCAKHSNMLLE